MWWYVVQTHFVHLLQVKCHFSRILRNVKNSVPFCSYGNLRWKSCILFVSSFTHCEVLSKLLKFIFFFQIQFTLNLGSFSLKMFVLWASFSHMLSLFAYSEYLLCTGLPQKQQTQFLIPPHTSKHHNMTKEKKKPAIKSFFF